MKVLRSASLLVLTSAALSAHALVSIDPFVGSLNDDFESYPNYIRSGGGVLSLTVFGGAAVFEGTSTSIFGPHVLSVTEDGTAYWGLGSLNGTAIPHSGKKGLGINEIAGPATLTFTSPVYSFGGYWETADSLANPLTLTFYGADGSLLGSDSFQHPDGIPAVPVWHGYADAAGIKKIAIVGNASPFVDDITANPVPEPASLCALGVGAVALIRRRTVRK